MKKNFGELLMKNFKRIDMKEIKKVIRIRATFNTMKFFGDLSNPIKLTIIKLVYTEEKKFDLKFAQKKRKQERYVKWFLQDLQRYEKDANSKKIKQKEQKEEEEVVKNDEKDKVKNGMALGSNVRGIINLFSNKLKKNTGAGEAFSPLKVKSNKDDEKGEKDIKLLKNLLKPNIFGNFKRTINSKQSGKLKGEKIPTILESGKKNSR